MKRSEMDRLRTLLEEVESWTTALDVRPKEALLEIRAIVNEERARLLVCYGEEFYDTEEVA